MYRHHLAPSEVCRENGHFIGADALSLKHVAEEIGPRPALPVGSSQKSLRVIGPCATVGVEPVGHQGSVDALDVSRAEDSPCSGDSLIGSRGTGGEIAAQPHDG